MCEGSPVSPHTVTQQMLLGTHLNALLLPVGCATHVLRKCLLSTLLCAKCLFKGCVCVSVCLCVWVCVCIIEGERAREPFLSYWLIMEDSRSCSWMQCSPDATGIQMPSISLL